MPSRETSRFSVAWVKDQFNLKNLDLDPPYQRRSVWSVSFQQFFIDSILRDFPVPPIFVNEEVSNDGRVIYHVIDGKQRLTAILDFLSDLFPIGKKSDPLLQKKYFSQLDPDLKKHILSYRLTFEAINLADNSTITIDEIYDRFNRNVAKLNDQELRKAKYQGEFSRRMEEIADELAEDSFWSGLKLFSRNAIRRMQDVEYVSELFILTMDGVQEPDVIDEYYAKYDDEMPSTADRIQKLFKKTKAEMENLELDFEATRYSNLNDFYSLWAGIRGSLLDKQKLNYGKTKVKLTAFSNEVDAAAPSYEGDINPGEDARRYSEAVRQGANKKNNRELRAELLRRRFVLSKSA